jgi:hypothetical protein
MVFCIEPIGVDPEAGGFGQEVTIHLTEEGPRSISDYTDLANMYVIEAWRLTISSLDSSRRSGQGGHRRITAISDVPTLCAWNAILRWATSSRCRSIACTRLRVREYSLGHLEDRGGGLAGLRMRRADLRSVQSG